jgi:hypothetical protein
MLRLAVSRPVFTLNMPCCGVQCLVLRKPMERVASTVGGRFRQPDLEVWRIVEGVCPKVVNRVARAVAAKDWQRGFPLQLKV